MSSSGRSSPFFVPERAPAPRSWHPSGTTSSAPPLSTSTTLTSAMARNFLVSYRASYRHTKAQAAASASALTGSTELIPRLWWTPGSAPPL
jgi:hypothetical protein